MTRFTSRLTFWLCLLTAAVLSPDAHAIEKPNILLIHVDDMGLGDWNKTGSDRPTSPYPGDLHGGWRGAAKAAKQPSNQGSN